MPDAIKKSLLVALDGSEHARQVVAYLTSLLPKQGYEVVLCHVTQAYHWKAWALKKDPGQDQEAERNWQAWLRQTQGAAEEMLEVAKGEFVAQGFDPDMVEVKVITGESGVAWDLLTHAAAGGYMAVALGRKGHSPLKDMVLGSTADRLVSRLTDNAVWVVGGEPRGKKILVAMDESEGSMRAVEYVSQAMGQAGVEVLLFHAVMNTESFRAMAQAYLPPDFEQQWVEEAERNMGPVMAQATQMLIAAGMPEDKISAKMVPDAPSRAWAITREADEGGFGTIVTGRRGLSQMEEIFLGRVSKKVLHAAKNQAVWVVG